MTHGEMLFNAYRDTVGFTLVLPTWRELTPGKKDQWERMAVVYDDLVARVSQ